MCDGHQQRYVGEMTTNLGAIELEAPASESGWPTLDWASLNEQARRERMAATSHLEHKKMNVKLPSPSELEQEHQSEEKEEWICHECCVDLPSDAVYQHLMCRVCAATFCHVCWMKNNETCYECNAYRSATTGQPSAAALEKPIKEMKVSQDTWDNLPVRVLRDHSGQ